MLARCYVSHHETRPRLTVPVHRDFLSLRYQSIEADGKVRANQGCERSTPHLPTGAVRGLR